MTDRYSPLVGLRVIDLSKVLAGPVCTQYLGDLGADVIKVEPCKGGDDTRLWPPFAGGDGAVFMSSNKNKRSIALNLKTEAGSSMLKRLIAGSDIFVESFRTGVTQKLGIDYEALKKVKPDIIYASISGFGRTGPLAGLPGYDVMLQAFSGIMSITGEKNRAPVRSAFSPLDQTTGVHTALGILAALRRRDQTGEGQFLETSLYETALSFLGYSAQVYWASGKLPEPAGSGHESLCPYQAFLANDGYILIAVGNDKLWRKLCPVLGFDQLGDDPRFSTNEARVLRFDETVKLVGAQIAKDNVGNWSVKLTEAGIPNSPINNLVQGIDQEQAAARNMIVSMPHPTAGSLKAISMPILFEGYDRTPRSAPPLLGEHSVEVLTELGVSASEVRDLINQGVVKTSDPISHASKASG